MSQNDKVKELTERLEEGVQAVFQSDQYKDYLKTMAKFHRYSFRNSMLIFLQNPEATHVAGYQTWQKEFNRHVKRGETGIRILAPAPYKHKVEMEKMDPVTQKPMLNEAGKPITEMVERSGTAFKAVSVFDISQTDGEPLPKLVNELDGEVKDYALFFNSLTQMSPFLIQFAEINSGSTKGRCNYETREITIKENMSQVQTMKTAIHEIAHAKLHDRFSKLDVPEDCSTREVEAESVAYVVCQHYGIDTSDYSFGYVAAWSSGHEVKELQSSLETIRGTASELIDAIDEHIAENRKTQDQAMVQEQVAEPEHTPTQGEDTFSIYQLKQGDETRDYRFEPYERLQAMGLSVDRANYEHIYSAPLTSDISLGDIFQKFNIDHPTDFTGHSLSVSDVVVLHQDDKDTAYYVDRSGYEQVPEFLQEQSKNKYYPIDEEAARRAKVANSFYEYRPGSATEEYRRCVDQAIKIAEHQKAQVDPSHHEKIDRVLDTYSRKLADNMNRGFVIDARVPSIMISGDGNFPVRQKEKQNRARDNNMEEWKKVHGLLDKIRGIGMGGISADDPNAVQKLQEKLSGLEQSQETMKAVNTYYRKYKTLDGCTHMPPEQIESVKEGMARSGRSDPKPFETWALSSNNAEIHRIKDRIQELTHRTEIGNKGWQFEGGIVEANKVANRLQIFFDGKPNEEVRAELKSNGFRWAPSCGAWQRLLNDNAIYAANRIKYLQPTPVTEWAATEVECLENEHITEDEWDLEL
ncbi:YodL domain-containing protein [Desulfitobacterium hafniense]|uniref:YodL domain-containing protein n=1 Tax=Desulfitobacterium hafniense TaxID=49338 RepID=UPI000365F8C7